MNYLTLGQIMILAELVTGIDTKTLNLISRVELLSSAVEAPSSSFDGQEFFDTFELKAAVLCSRIAKNHALPDGNKRLAWQSLVMFCRINSFDLITTEDDAVETIIKVASGEIKEHDLATWIKQKITKKEY
ncbi:MAG: type II toxin-antitoxin system death-on-curing family toxin [Actinomycetes bacterium]